MTELFSGHDVPYYPGNLVRLARENRLVRYPVNSGLRGDKPLGYKFEFPIRYDTTKGTTRYLKVWRPYFLQDLDEEEYALELEEHANENRIVGRLDFESLEIK